MTQEDQPSRRDLLGSLFDGEEPAADSSVIPVAGGPVFSYSANAMGCLFQLLCDGENQQTIAWHAPEALQLIADLEQELSIYRDSSPMSAINQLQNGEHLKISRDLFDLLSSAVEISRASGGAFDISATPLSRLWKMCRHERRLPEPVDIERLLPYVGNNTIRLDEQQSSISLTDQRVQLDLGGIGKGYALDRVRELLHGHEAEHFLIHGGQSSVVASGLRDGSQRWEVGITHPLSPGVRLAQVALQDQSIGTSGSGRQSFVVAGQRYGHIIDPRTGWPADHMLAATVIADSAMMADALATAIFVAGFDHTQTICDQFNLGAILVSADASSGQLQIDRINVADDAWTMLV
ncbi:MAG: FAD:protein FMN transferase [Pirellulaceae bacterium]